MTDLFCNRPQLVPLFMTTQWLDQLAHLVCGRCLYPLAKKFQNFGQRFCLAPLWPIGTPSFLHHRWPSGQQFCFAPRWLIGANFLIFTPEKSKPLTTYFLNYGGHYANYIKR